MWALAVRPKRRLSVKLCLFRYARLGRRGLPCVRHSGLAVRMVTAQRACRRHLLPLPQQVLRHNAAYDCQALSRVNAPTLGDGDLALRPLPYPTNKGHVQLHA